MPTPAEIFGASIGLNLRAEDLVLADGAQVASWADISGKGHVFSQATAAKRPTMVTAEPTLNGLPAVKFDGVDDFMDVVKNAETHVEFPTILMVMKHLNVKQGWSNTFTIPHQTFHTDPYARVGLAQFWETDTTARWDLRRDTTVYGHSVQPITNAMILAYHIRTVKLYINGTILAGPRPIGGATYPNETPFRLGAHSAGGENAAMVLAEFVLVKRDITDAERAQWNAYASAKYGIAVSDTGATPGSSFFGITGMISRVKAGSLGLPDGAAVESWTDLSPVGGHYVNATAAHRPTFKAAVPELNNKPAIYFDGVDDNLRADTSERSGASTVFWVGVPRVKGFNSQPLFARKNSGGDFELYNDANIGGWITGAGNTVNVTTATPHVLDAGAVYTLAGGSGVYEHRLYRNGTKVGEVLGSGEVTGNYSGLLTLGYNAGNGQRHFQGDVAEVIAFDRILTDAERAIIHTYIQDEYGIAVTDAFVSPNPKVKTLSDNFEGAEKFYRGGGAEYIGGRGRIPSLQSYGDSFSGVGKFDLRNSEVVLEVPLMPAANASELFLALRTTGNADSIEFYKTGGAIGTRWKRAFGSQSVGSIGYNAVNHRWWRIRENGGFLYWDYSPDSINWTNLRVETTPIDVSDLEIVIFSGNWQGAADAGYYEIDNFNNGATVTNSTPIQQRLGTATATTVTTTLPAPATAGNRLFALLGIDKSSGYLTVPAGWERVASHIATSVSGAVFTKVAEGGESSAMFSWANSKPMNWWMAEFEGGGGNLVAHIEANNVEGLEQPTVTVPSFVAPGKGLAISVVAKDSAVGFSVDGGGFSKVTESGTAIGHGTIAIASRLVDAGAAVGPVTWTATSPDEMWAVNILVTDDNFPAKPNLIATDPDFEIGSYSKASQGSAVLTHSTEQAHSGTKSLKVTSTSGGGESGAQSLGLTTRPFLAGEIVTGSAWVYADAGAEIRIVLRFTSTAGTQMVNETYLVGATGWHRISRTDVVAADSTDVSIKVVTPTTGATYYVDDIKVEENWISAFGEATPPPSGLLVVNVGGQWVGKPVKVDLGSGYVIKPAKFWNGSAWVAT